MKTKSQMRAMFDIKVMVFVIGAALMGCMAFEPEEPEIAASEAAVEAPAAEAFVCGARNCVARCATCVFRRCLENGTPEETCEVQRDLCIDDCNQPEECQPGQPCDPNPF